MPSSVKQNNNNNKILKKKKKTFKVSSTKPQGDIQLNGAQSCDRTYFRNS